MFEFITESGNSYNFWIVKDQYNYKTSLVTRPHGFIFEIVDTKDGKIIDWDKYIGRREKMSQIKGYVEYLEKFVKLMVFI